MDMAFLQTYMIPVLMLFYGLLLLLKPPKPGASWGFCTKRTQKSEAEWKYAQLISGIYCVAAAIILYGLITLLKPHNLVQIILELAFIGCLYPVVIALLNKKFPNS